MIKNVGDLKAPIRMNINTTFDFSGGVAATLLILKGKTLLKKSKIPPQKFVLPIKVNKFVMNINELSREEWKVIAIKELSKDRQLCPSTRLYDWHFWISPQEQTEFTDLRWDNKAITVQRILGSRAYLLAKLRREP